MFGWWLLAIPALLTLGVVSYVGSGKVRRAARKGGRKVMAATKRERAKRAKAVEARRREKNRQSIIAGDGPTRWGRRDERRKADRKARAAEARAQQRITKARAAAKAERKAAPLRTLVGRAKPTGKPKTNQKCGATDTDTGKPCGNWRTVGKPTCHLHGGWRASLTGRAK